MYYRRLDLIADDLVNVHRDNVMGTYLDKVKWNMHVL